MGAVQLFPSRRTRWGVAMTCVCVWSKAQAVRLAWEEVVGVGLLSEGARGCAEASLGTLSSGAGPHCAEEPALFDSFDSSLGGTSAPPSPLLGVSPPPADVGSLLSENARLSAENARLRESARLLGLQERTSAGRGAADLPRAGAVDGRAPARTGEHCATEAGASGGCPDHLALGGGVGQRGGGSSTESRSVLVPLMGAWGSR